MNIPTDDSMPAIRAWQLEFARLIAFPASPPFFIDQKWWQDLTTDRATDPAHVRKEHVREDRGIFQGVSFSLTVDLQRIEWKVRPASEIDPSGNFNVLGGFRDKLDWFVEMLSPWLASSCPPLFRLALCAKLLQPAASAEDAYRVLAVHLPAVNLDSTPNDFLLQINRRKASSDVVAGLPINRVCTWSKMNAPFLIDPGKAFQWPSQCYTALELDINTAPEKGEILPRELLSRLFSELASLGKDIAEQGDVP